MKQYFDVKTMPVRSKILIMVISFWVIPLMIIGGYSIIFYSNSINSRINEYLRNQFYYYNEFAVEKLDAAIDASKNATYDMVIEYAYSKYVSGEQPWGYFINQVDGYLREKYYLDKRYLMSAFFLADDTDSISINSRMDTAEIQYYRENVHIKAVEMAKGLGTDVGFITDNNKVYIVRNMMMVRGPFKRFGVIVLQVDPNYLFGHMFDPENMPKSVAVSLNDSILRFNPGYKESLEVPKDNLVENLLSTNDSHIDTDDKSVSFYNKIQTDDYSIGLGMALDRDVVYSKYRNLRSIVYFIALLTVPCIIFVFYFLYRNVSSPIQKLVAATKNIKNGDFGIHLDEDSMRNYEFKMVASSFNSMSSELKRLFEYVYKEELALKDAKILALQAQINPHFLGNTLEMMNWQARMAGDVEVSNMIEALSVLLDSSMDRSNKRLVPLSEELLCIDAYLFIISKRFGKRITIEKDIDNDLLPHMVPRLILQPLIENAVVHGIEPVQSGTITIRVYKDKGHMIINIINNGKEIEDDELTKINEMLNSPNGTARAERLGVRNVNERIRLIYGEEYGLAIGKDSEERTVTEIKMPLGDVE
jgi:Predicted signal transduction protein with a C-terminal ATPase domain